MMDVTNFNGDGSNIKLLKNSLTLDLHSNGPSRKKTLLGPSSNNNGLLSGGQIWTPSSTVLLESPDVKRCKLGTPELDRLIYSISSANNNTLTPTPSLAHPPPVAISTTTTSCVAAITTTTSAVSSNNLSSNNNNNNNVNSNNNNQSRNHNDSNGMFDFNPRPEITEAQALYARGFEDALERIRSQDGGTNSDSSLTCSRPLSNSSASSIATIPPTTSIGATATSLAMDILSTARSNFPSTIGPNLIGNRNPSMSPIDMKDQERIKLERKRLRNRIAASKCRRRKLEKISRLEDKVKTLKAENQELSTAVSKLRDHVCSLKEEVMEHVKQGCMIMQGNVNI